MNQRLIILSLLVAVGTLLTPQAGHADDSSGLSPAKLKVLDKRGYFTPSFKRVVHDMVDALKGISDANDETKKLTDELPDLQKQVADAQAKSAALRVELAKYEHPDEYDFGVLQQKMKDASATPQDQLVLAQAYVWTYPASPHLPEAQQDMQDLQKKIADQIQAEKDAEAARIAARAKLVERAQAHDLSLAEWRDFLRDMSQDDMLKYLGPPDNSSLHYWNYTGDWTTDPMTQKKAGLQINFNGTRVISVALIDHP